MIELLCGTVYLVLAAVFLASLVQLRRFLATTATIADRAALDRFRALARIQMYLALVVMVLGALGVAVSVFLVQRHGLAGLAVVLVINALVFLFGLYHKTVEARARSLEVAAEPLESEYRRIADTWVRKPLPDF
jgi:hypothetical protein